MVGLSSAANAWANVRESAHNYVTGREDLGMNAHREGRHELGLNALSLIPFAGPIWKMAGVTFLHGDMTERVMWTAVAQLPFSFYAGLATIGGYEGQALLALGAQLAIIAPGVAKAWHKWCGPDRWPGG